jgi:hypothetical protein
MYHIASYFDVPFNRRKAPVTCTVPLGGKLHFAASAIVGGSLSTGPSDGRRNS